MDDLAAGAPERRRRYRGLLISDCEGYEIDLFRPDVLKALAGWDLIIETHDSHLRPFFRRLPKHPQPYPQSHLKAQANLNSQHAAISPREHVR